MPPLAARCTTSSRSWSRRCSRWPSLGLHRRGCGLRRSLLLRRVEHQHDVVIVHRHALAAQRGRNRGALQRGMRSGATLTASAASFGLNRARSASALRTPDPVVHRVSRWPSIGGGRAPCPLPRWSGLALAGGGLLDRRLRRAPPELTALLLVLGAGGDLELLEARGDLGVQRDDVLASFGFRISILAL